MHDKYFMDGTQPPRAQNAATHPALGERAFASTNVATTTKALTGDIFLQDPDAGGNAAKEDFVGTVVVEFEADGDDIMIQTGSASGGNAALSFAAVSPGGNANIGRVVYNAKATGGRKYRMTLSAGHTPGGAGADDYLTFISRTGTTGVLRYRVVSRIPGAR